MGPDDHDPELRTLLRRYWGYKWLIASVVILGVVSTWLLVQDIVPRYTATAIVLFAPPERNVIEIQDVIEAPDAQEDTIESEEEVLKSRELATKAAEKLGLYENRSFHTGREGTSFFAHLNPVSYIPPDWKDTIGAFVADPKNAIFGNPNANGVTIEIPLYEELDKIRRNRIIKEYLTGLTLIRAPRSRVIRIAFTFEDPRLAAEAANVLADTYVQETLDIKYAGTREAAELLDQQLDDLKQKVEDSEATAEKLRQGQALVRGRSSEIITEQISALNQQLLEAHSETTGLVARLQQIKDLRSGPNGAEDGSALFESPMIQTLRMERFRLEREEADLALELGDKHPKLVNIRAEKSDIEEKLQHELEKIVSAAKNEVSVAQQKEASIRNRLNEVTNQVSDANEVEVQLRALEREADANRSLYEAFLTRSKETSVQIGFQQPDARVISYAEVPQIPSYPPTQRYMMTALVVSMGVAIGLVYLFERLDKGFRTAKQVEEQLGLRVIALVPQVKDNDQRPEDLILDTNHSRFTEAINAMYAHLKWPRGATKQTTILVTSAMPKEGKTATAIALARRAAYLGDRVLLIDGDFRNPKATRQLRLKQSPGIAEILAKSEDPEDALQKDEASGAWFLSSGRSEEDPVALIGSSRFRALLENLRDGFDLIVLDSSPALAVTEPEILSRLADQTLLLVRWGKTPRDAAMAAARRIREFGGNIAGIGLTQVNLKQNSYYGYGEYGYYTSRMKEYYTR